jgi:UDP-4-amino-4,6-dideoxy-N-acetyl-beta-L-altrosamine transaminase
MEFIPYGKQHIDQDDINAVLETLQSDYITQGPKINEFEQHIAKYVGSKYAVTFNSGTAALHASYFALGLSDGDEFITTPITFVATANAGVYLGATPIFCDVDPSSGNIDPKEIEKKITKQTKLIAPVHYSGNPVDLEKIYTIAKKYNLFVVEDAAHALGTEYKESRTGDCKYSDITIFSFHPVKHITTGEGGAATTNSKDVYEKLLLFRSHGKTKDNNRMKRKNEGPWYFEMQALGYNYRMTDIQAALGISQLNKLESFVKKRRQIAQKYDQVLKDSPYFEPIQQTHEGKSAYHLYPVLLKNKYVKYKKEIFSQAFEKKIGLQVHYMPINMEPFYEKKSYSKDDTPCAHQFYEQILSIPIYPDLHENQQNHVMDTLNCIMKTIPS